MINGALIGYGKMGRQLQHMMEIDEGISCAGIIDPLREEMESDVVKLVENLQSGGKHLDVIIDFSHPDNLEMILRGAERYHIPLVIATTGFTGKQEARMVEAAKELPIVYSSNYSLGIAVMKHAIKEMKDALGAGFDIEIIEKHHRQKIDSPSGTAKTLLKTLDPGEELDRKHGREGYGKRGNEIGVHAVRGGTVAGEHTVIFAGDNEVLELTHRAESRQVFASGALRAAKYIVGRKAGIYSIDEVLFGG